MLEQYFKVDEKSLGYFFGLVVGAVVVVTLIYWLVFGFDRWSGQMQRASQLMTAAATAPVGQTVATPAPQAAGQYVCPTDGAVGLPRFDANDVPRCPLDNQVMTFIPAQTGDLLPAAAPG